MTAEYALVPQYLARRNAEGSQRVLENILVVGLGVLLLSGLAQIVIPLPWTPVPITGQTFGVALTALMWGRKRALAIILNYVLLGAMGLPIFAIAKLGPTVGYLVGMVFSAYAMGALADLGWTKTFGRTYCAGFIGSMITFICGVIGLSFFLPTSGADRLAELLTAGLVPFLPGDFIKTLLASTIAYRAQRLWEKNL